jgi:hypothetical protein
MTTKSRREILVKGLAMGALVTSTAPAAAADGQQTGTSTNSAIPNPTPLVDGITDYASKKVAALRPLSVAPPPKGGKDPLPRDTKTWQEILARANKFLSVTSDETLGATFDPALLQIARGFLFKSELGDKNFQENQVEELLSTSSLLLDRGLRDKREWQEKAEKRFNVASELLEYRELDKIHIEETAAGFYIISATESTATRDAELQLVSGNRAAASYLDWLLKNKYSNAELNAQSAEYQLMGWLAHLAAYQYPFMGDLLKNVWNGQPNTSPEFMKNSAFITSWHTFATQSSTLLAQQASFSSAGDSSDQKGVGYRARADWEDADVAFRRRRTGVARWIADLKARAFTEPGGALNFSEQMVPIKARFERDFRDAIARIFVAAQGLKDIYGYAVPLPDRITGVKSGAADSDAVFDDCASWVRDAVAWLTRFSYLDQNYTLPVSVRRAVGKDKWKLGLKNGFWLLPMEENLFPNQAHVRLRGISAFVVFDQSSVDLQRDSSLWNVALRAPKNGTVRHLDGTMVNIDQSFVPPARLARVGLRNSFRDPDITGVAAMHNVSPIGDWQIAVGKRSIEGVNLDRIIDLQVDLHLAVRSSDSAFTSEQYKNVLQLNEIE